MFSSEFGKGKKSSTTKVERRKDKLQAFLSQHYVFCQSYLITEDIEYINKSLIGFKLIITGAAPTSSIKNVHLPEIEPPMTRKSMDKNALEYPIQYVCHIPDQETGQIKFIAFDSFYSHHFSLTPHENRLGGYTTFYGNNETHMQEYYKEFIVSKDTSEE